ncbi:BNR/Asp-box repeat protein [Phyllosticta citrichinensis]|uniref:BNR/Asp-box repeat protein n=1 Tax=Phyllosticta citrichinensis TaxID=1130410 RepID=A0ABR1XZR9_9PEZI
MRFFSGNTGEALSLRGLRHRLSPSYRDPGTCYARALLLDDNSLLAPWENHGPEPVYFPVFHSTDENKSWQELSKVEDTVNRWGLRYQPTIYKLPRQVGRFPAGTILVAGDAVPPDSSRTKIEIFASTYQAKTWTHVSTVAEGGRSFPTNGETPVWEPFFVDYEGQLVCYYTDQRDPAHGQKLVHSVSRDLLSWSPPVNDVAYDTYEWRPGMTTIAKLPSGDFILTYEFFGAREAPFAVYYRVSRDPLNFNAAEGRVLKATDGNVPTSSPYVVWTPAGGESGTIVVSASDVSELSINTSPDAAGPWTQIPCPEPASYSRSLTVLRDPSKILVAGGGPLKGKAGSNRVTISIITFGGR